MGWECPTLHRRTSAEDCRAILEQTSPNKGALCLSRPDLFSTLKALSHGVKPPEGGVTSKVTLGEVNQPLATWTLCSPAAKTGIPRDATMTR